MSGLADVRQHVPDQQAEPADAGDPRRRDVVALRDRGEQGAASAGRTTGREREADGEQRALRADAEDDREEQREQQRGERDGDVDDRGR